MTWIEFLASHLWQYVWAVVPLALVAAVACRLSRCGPVTRHGLWVIVLLWFVVPPLLPPAPSASWLQRIENRLTAESPSPDVAPTDDKCQDDAAAGGAAEIDGDRVADGGSAAPFAVNQRPEEGFTFPRSVLVDASPRLYAPIEPRVRLPLNSPPLTTVLQRDETGLSDQPSLAARAARGVAAQAEVAVDDKAAHRAVAPAVVRDTGSANLAPQLDRAAPDVSVDAAVREVSSSAWKSDSRRSDPDASAASIALPDRESTAVVEAAAPRPAPPASCENAIATRFPEAQPDDKMPEPPTAWTTEPTTAAPPVTAEDTPEPRPLQAWWRSWLAAALVVRAALADLPAMPTSVWVGGTAVVLLWNALGIVLFLRRMRRGEPPPAWVVREAQHVADSLRLRRLPTICMTAASLPPMVWCGWRSRLILPKRLWRTLDSAGRQAILCHELAHLRRRDHWIQRLNLLVGVLFWWHPVAWWTGRHIQEEADNCCDAWVTWLMPRDRRAYAEALLKTRVFIEKTNRAAPVMSAAVITPGAKRLARRLTMVMTQTIRPRQSFWGIVLASVVIALGWLLTPAVSIAQHVAPPAAPEAPTAAATVDDADETTPAATVHAATAASAEPLFKPSEPASKNDGPMASKSDAGESVAKTYKLSRAKLKALTKLLSRDDVPLKVRQQPGAIEVIATPREHEIFAAFVREIDQQTGPNEWREYPLPEGKLDELYALMARQDVPITVSRGDGVLRAQVTPQQDEIMRGFLALINPEGGPPQAQKTRARGGATWTSRSKAPAPWGVAVPPMPPAPPAPPVPLAPPKAAPTRVPPARTAPPSLEHQQERGRRQWVESIKAYGDQLKQCKNAQRQQVEVEVKLLRAKAAELAKQAAELDAQIDKMHDQMEKLQDAASDAGGNASQQRQLERQIRELEKGTRQIEREMERLNALSEKFEEKADQQEARCDDLDNLTDELEARLDESNEDSADDDDDAAVEGDEEAPIVEASSEDADVFLVKDEDRGDQSPLLYLCSLGNAICLSTLGLPTSAAPQVNLALAESLRGVKADKTSAVRITLDRARHDIGEQVRRNLRERLETSLRSEPVDQLDIEAISDEISKNVSDAVTASLEHTFADVDIAISIRGAKCEAACNKHSLKACHSIEEDGGDETPPEPPPLP